MSRMLPFAFWLFLATGGLCGIQPILAAGMENFNNFPVTTNSYLSGTFVGQDGSTWTYSKCQGSKIITAPRTPGLAKGTPIAYLESGTLTGGCGTISFDWMRMFTGTVSVDVVVNDTLRHTITGGVQNVTNHAGPLAINVGGNFTLKFQQHDSQAGQVAIDNVAWTSYGGSAPEPPVLLFAPDTNSVRLAYSNVVQLAVTATEPNVDVVRLWAAGLPAGAAFNAATGTTPLLSNFSWTPTSAQTGLYAVVFYAGDKDGTNSRTFSIEVTPIYPYYHYAEGLTGAALKAKLHEIISAGAVQLTDTQENDAMKVLHTDPANSNNVLLLYNPTSSVPKSAYNDSPNGWNKEHCWPESRGLGNEGPDQIDVHNLYAEHVGANALRGNLFFDESDTNDIPAYRAPATNVAPETSMDSNSFEPPPTSKGNVARAIFYMATRYDGNEPDTSALAFSDNPAHTNVMGILTNLLLWHALDPPDVSESNRNETIYSTYQHNRNPFIDRPEWVEQIWGTDTDSDGATDTHEIIAGSNPKNSNSVFEATLNGAGLDFQVTCGLLTTGSVWRLYQGAFSNSEIVWRQIAQTNRLESGWLRFDVAPTGSAAFFHLRALRP
jgi:endonuclease I